MSFHTLDYLLFLPMVVLIYFLIPHRSRWVVLLVASNLFYASWRVEFLALIWFSLITDYAVARAMPGARPRNRKILLAISLTTNLGLLGFFKFASPFVDEFINQSNAVSGSVAYQFLLPLGISFYTFQTLGYVLDVYHGKRAPERHLGYFANFVMYFPQLIAGPVEKAGKLLPQFHRDQSFDIARATAGGALILIGYYKKLVVADGLSVAINPIMAGDPVAQAPLTLLIGSLGTVYTYYADLSGYVDIAIGSSLILGIQLSQNFRRPFAAKSVTDFWQRWHITVSHWFRDHVYLPLVYLRPTNMLFRFFAVMLTMVIIAIWHGAQSTWLLVGIISGLIIGFRVLARKWLAKRGAGAPITIGSRIMKVLLTAPAERAVFWLFLVVIGALVGTGSVESAWQMGRTIAQLPYQVAALDRTGINAVPLYIVLAIIALEVFQWLDEKKPVMERLQNIGPICTSGFYLALISIIVIFGTYNSPDFLYFRI